MIYSAHGTTTAYLEIYEKKIGLSVGKSYFQNSTEIADGEWHHVVAVMERDKGITIYVDGIGETGGAPESTDLQFTSDIFFGKYSGGGYYWNGALADIKIYNRAITDDEVLSVYSGINETSQGLIGKWHESNAAGSSIVDTISGNDARLYGAIPSGDLNTVVSSEMDSFFLMKSEILDEQNKITENNLPTDDLTKIFVK
ncbi:Laminin G, subdomain protein 2 domain protein [Candidatus Omnitrophus magneticus]|uniref:Laminin G, subdomain protein 2 domain protein n=1 Tax=Candidatus Omnitrophus magneticus TaxID=1609969 RepID=A0A0F0CMT7_9BACT|nr:Laminin G, subdomain protein 2 domain protein [Candidatus Omnitrophus magneticus]